MRTLYAVAAVGLTCNFTMAGVIFGSTGLNGGFRWDAAPRTLGGLERSLNDGLRYSLQGGSYQAYRDLFTWSGTAPSVASFQSAVEKAFAAWTIPDPVSGLTTAIQFTPDLGTPVNSHGKQYPIRSLRLGFPSAKR